VDDRLIQPLLDLAASQRPDAVIVSGDLTQRARPSQFSAARAYLARFSGPVLVVPGNHDMPLYNLPVRLAAPLARYRKAFGAGVEPSLTLPDAVIQGVNTSDPFVWKAGRLRRSSVARLTAAFAGAPAEAHRIAVMHHAPVPAADGTPADIAEPAKALADLAATGAQVVLSGHTHMPHAGFAETAAGVLFLQVGTAISTRLKTDANDVAVIDLAPGLVTRTSWIARGGGVFEPSFLLRFRQGSAGWQQSAD
jgi:3',5'-cyclic AMP phosphodiesterase CpdA